MSKVRIFLAEQQFNAINLKITILVFYLNKLFAILILII